MPNYDFSAVPDSTFELIPEGSYLVQVNKVEVKFDNAQVEKWTLTLKILEGEFQNKNLLDFIKWNPTGLKRIKLILSRLGFNVDGKLNVMPEDIEGKVAYICVKVEPDFKDPQIQRNKIPYDGYKTLDKHPNPTDAQLIAKNAIALFKTGGQAVNTPTSTDVSVGVDPSDLSIEDVPF